MLQQQMNQQFTSIFANASLLMKQKDDEIIMANIKSMELQQLLKKMEMENQELQKMAMHNELIVVSLRNTLSQIEDQENAHDICEDAGSCCQDSRSQSQSQSRDIGICRRCNSYISSVIFLPCRHLCSCYACEPFMSSCPVCNLPKKTSIPVFI
ncbi:E3 ubiquitin-protein ligase BOI-like [Impatiens glandulifera]|uniref:E3 ubiquitin-protein ligase BOI-like n=1 Tax=Impatiens glandulifera TaxID=253017 RepID=UPI001FB0D597|nr:E3 ubiquitin-protein ligase BOI-like [Impatiens glandulifera]